MPSLTRDFGSSGSCVCLGAYIKPCLDVGLISDLFAQYTGMQAFMLIFLHLTVAFLARVLAYPHINIVSMHLGRATSPSGYWAMSSALTYIVDRIKKGGNNDAFQNITYRALVDSGHTLGSGNVVTNIGSANVDGITRMLAEVIQFRPRNHSRVGLMAFVLPVSSQEFSVIGDFGREADFLCMPCTTADSIVADRSRFPTSVSFAQGSSTPYADALLTLYKTCGWKYIAVINDQETHSRTPGRSREHCRGPIEQMESRKTEFEMQQFFVDSFVDNFTHTLISARTFSRIILGCALGIQQRRLLADAYDLGMTTGDYVFLYLYELEIPYELPLWWKWDDSQDMKVRDALRSTIVVRSEPVNWDEMANTTRAIQIIRQRMYGTSQLDDQNNEFNFPCNEAVYTLAQILRENCVNNDPRCTSGRFMAEKMLNRTYNSRLRQYTITSRGYRRIDVWLQQYDWTSDSMKTLYTYNSWAKRLIAVDNVQPQWITGTPSDRPKCAISLDRCSRSSNVALAVPLAVIIVLSFLLLLCWRFKGNPLRYLTYSDGWWIIEPQEIYRRQIYLY